MIFFKYYFRILSSSFFKKSDMEQWLKPQLLRTDYGEMIEAIWDFSIEKKIKFYREGLELTICWCFIKL